jgi:hypothetical protein
MSDYHVFVHTGGCRDWPRFTVRNSRGEHWTGHRWSSDPNEALVFNLDEEASQIAGKLFRENNQRLFVGSFAIRVECDRAFTLDELKKFYTEKFRGLLVDGDFGAERIEVEMGWDDMMEIE